MRRSLRVGLARRTVPPTLVSDTAKAWPPKIDAGPEGPMGRGSRTPAEQLQHELGLTGEMLRAAHVQIAEERQVRECSL